MLFQSFLRNPSPCLQAIDRTKVDSVVDVFHDVLGIRLYPVQIEAALALTQGRIAEVQTGEGKTFITGLAAALLADDSVGVHVATTNEYLSRRDYEQLRAVFRCLGLTVSCLHGEQSADEKRVAYCSDITYGSGCEFGFDYLRDQVNLTSQGSVPAGRRFLDALNGLPSLESRPIQIRRGVAIIDEADSVMIDEAGTPLVLGSSAGATSLDEEALREANSLATEFEAGRDFQLNQSRCVFSVEADNRIREQHKRVANSPLRRPWPQYVSQAVMAHHRYARNVDYVVSEGKVAIIDVHTGRIHPERTWRGGLHQAIEIKEGLQPTCESSTAAQITRQRFLQKYDLLCGLTGTATGNEKDFQTFFGLKVQVFPTHRPSLRQRLPSLYFSSIETKERFASSEAIRIASDGRAVIVATRSIEEADRMGKLIRIQNPSVRILHGMQDEDEAELVGQAGRPNRITVTTSIAGRGTDIKVAPEVLQRGGLHLISTQHHDSMRVDRQLAGRVARQGQPGSVQQLASLHDMVLESHAASFVLARRIQSKLARLDSPNGTPVPSIDRAIQKLQRQLEHHGHVQRLQLVDRDQWINRIQNEVA
ncbi:MAG: preprotein translocase subunit SecA [bacterium]|nr:preprotein translocase subunit SecA [bacterium]